MNFRVAMAQVNPTVGDLEGNARLVKEYIQKARQAKADLVAFPEMVITGYPPLDMLPPKEMRSPGDGHKPEREDFVWQNKKLVLDLAGEVRDLVAIVGFVDYEGYELYNAAAVIAGGEVRGIVHKTLLPTYDVFDEQRYFTPAKQNTPVEVNVGPERLPVGVSVCEDLWDEEIGYSVKVVDALAEKGARLAVNINASPFHYGKRAVRIAILKEKARKLSLPLFYVNMVGGQDELIFDGESLAVDATGRLIGIGKQFAEDLIVVDLDIDTQTAREVTEPERSREEEIFGGLVLGVRDYFRKTGFKRALVGLSGGIDSSLVACVAVEALGNENVAGVSMPSRYSSDHSVSDAAALASNLGIRSRTIPIEPAVSVFGGMLAETFKGLPANEAEENIQARIRGNILMALSNKFGELVLSTGNKTELALGYSTLYGDMSGGLAVIGDVSKTEVYALARYYNTGRGREIIPENCFKKIPSAELRPNQFDPFDYAVVSPLVEEIIENRLSRAELIQKGYQEAVVDDTLRRIRAAEYKRRQAPPTIKITKKAFGLGWKMPIVNKFSG